MHAATQNQLHLAAVMCSDPAALYTQRIILAVGSRSVVLPGIEADGSLVVTSTEALALAVANVDLTRLIRIWLANRGIWEALPGAGPNVPIPATGDDIQHYLTAYDELRDALTT